MSLWYCATPYTKYQQGLHEAHKAACEQAAFLLTNGVPVISPIAHSHWIALHGQLDPLDHEFWMAQCRPLMEKCDGMICCQLPGWAESVGMRMERDWFLRAGRPVIQMVPWEVPERLLVAA